MNLYESIGGRKAAACISGLVVVTTVFFVKGSVPEDFLTAIQWLVTTYIAGNVATDVVAAIPARVVDVSNDQTEKKLAELETHITNLNVAVGVQDQSIRQIFEHVSKQP